MAVVLPVGRGYLAACFPWLYFWLYVAISQDGFGVSFMGVIGLWLFCCLLAGALSLPIGRGFFAACSARLSG